MLKTQVMTIAGKDYDYTFCDRCGIWIQSEKIEAHIGSPDCDKHLKNRPIRERATGRALGKINKVYRNL